eukprot:g1054.t1
MQRYCREAERIILDEGPGILKMAAECLNHVGYHQWQVQSPQSLIRKGITPAIDALIRKCTRSNLAQRDASQMKDCCDLLLLLAKERGGKQSEKLFREIFKSSEAGCLQVLLRILEERYSSSSCASRSEVTESLVKLLDWKETRGAAVKGLRKYAVDDPAIKDPLLRCLDDPDHLIRLDVLKILMDRSDIIANEEDPIRLRSNPSSSVVQFTLKRASRCDPSRLSRDLVAKAVRFLDDADARSRLEATKLLGKVKSEVADLALKSLKVTRPWPERDAAVLEARKVALDALSQITQ